MTTPRIEVSKRSVYEYGKRKRVVYDAKCSEPCRCEATEATRAAALAVVATEHHYVCLTAPLVHGSCKLQRTGLFSWCFTLRAGSPTASSMLFNAASASDALEVCRRSYHDHPDCIEFFEASPLPCLSGYRLAQTLFGAK